MTSRLTLVSLTLIAMLTSIAVAQDAEDPKPHAPPVISDETIGILRQHQVGSIILPNGTPPYPAVVVLHGCNGVSQNTFVWARRLASWGYAALIINSFNPLGASTSMRREPGLVWRRAGPGRVRGSGLFALAV